MVKAASLNQVFLLLPLRLAHNMKPSGKPKQIGKGRGMILPGHQNVPRLYGGLMISIRVRPTLRMKGTL